MNRKLYYFILYSLCLCCVWVTDFILCSVCALLALLTVLCFIVRKVNLPGVKLFVLPNFHNKYCKTIHYLAFSCVLLIYPIQIFEFRVWHSLLRTFLTFDILQVPTVLKSVIFILLHVLESSFNLKFCARHPPWTSTLDSVLNSTHFWDGLWFLYN